MTDAEDREPTFEEALDGLEHAVEALERGDLELGEALARFEAGVRLLAAGTRILDAAGRRVALLSGVADDGTPETAPFDDPAAPGADAGPARPPRPRKGRRAASPTEAARDDVEPPF